jgi:3D (Asp-Asp-Asp) domain-containing protein
VTSCGSRVYGAAVAADTGGFANKKNPAIADVFFGFTRDCYLKALQWGSQQVDVYVINTGIY